MLEVIKMTNLSYGDIARELGVSRQFIHQLVTDNKPIPIRNKKKLYIILMNNLIDNIDKSKEGVEVLSRILTEESVVTQSK